MYSAVVFHKQWVEGGSYRKQLQFFHLLPPVALQLLLSFPQKSSSFNKQKQVRQERLEQVLFQNVRLHASCRCSTQLVAVPLNNNLNALLKQHFNEWQTLPLCHTLSRSCFTIAVSFKKFPVTNLYIHPSPKENYNFVGILNIPKDILFLLPCQYKDKV